MSVFKVLREVRLRDPGFGQVLKSRNSFVNFFVSGYPAESKSSCGLEFFSATPSLVVDRISAFSKSSQKPVTREVHLRDSGFG